MNKASGSDEIPNELFNFIKDDDCLSATQNMSANLENSAVSHRTGKGQFSFQSQIKTKPKNVQTPAQLHS